MCPVLGSPLQAAGGCLHKVHAANHSEYICSQLLASPPSLQGTRPFPAPKSDGSVGLVYCRCFRKPWVRCPVHRLLSQAEDQVFLVPTPTLAHLSSSKICAGEKHARFDTASVVDPTCYHKNRIRQTQILNILQDKNHRQVSACKSRSQQYLFQFARRLRSFLCFHTGSKFHAHNFACLETSRTTRTRNTEHDSWQVCRQTFPTNA